MTSISDRKHPAAGRSAINSGRYLDAVLGMWAGKFIGGTLGAPIEGVKTRHGFAVPLSFPAEVAENDDTDLQLLWLHALEEHGVRLTARELVAEWREHVRAPWNEYGVAAANWERGVLPPESGRLNNWFWGEGMGCPIRSEIWAAICPGAPGLAARFAEMDASIDHRDNSVEAEKFLAALEAQAIVGGDLDALLDAGLQQVARGSRFYSLVRDVRAWAGLLSWVEARERVLREYGHPEMTHVLQNVGFTLIGLLFGGGDLERTLAVTLNCGYDADCTAATAGAILGAMRGCRGIPDHLLAQVSDRYVVSDWMRGFPRTGSIEELSQACCAFGSEVARDFATGVELGRVSRPSRLPVTAVCRPPLAPRPNPFPIWRIVGPFWRPWTERIKSDWEGGEHGIPHLPSVHYFSHNQSGFDHPWVDPRQLFSVSDAPAIAARSWVREAQDDRVPLDGLATMEGPACYYAAAEFETGTARKAWLMLGATGPIEAWWNGERVLFSESYQPLAPTSFPVEVVIAQGRNRVVLKLAKTSQPLGACLTLKRNDGKHWHQSFIDTDIEWVNHWPADASA